MLDVRRRAEALDRQSIRAFCRLTGLASAGAIGHQPLDERVPEGLVELAERPVRRVFAFARSLDIGRRAGFRIGPVTLAIGVGIVLPLFGGRVVARHSGPFLDR